MTRLLYKQPTSDRARIGVHFSGMTSATSGVIEYLGPEDIRARKELGVCRARTDVFSELGPMSFPSSEGTVGVFRARTDVFSELDLGESI